MSLFSRFFLILLSTALGPIILAGAWFLGSTQQTRENARLIHQQFASLAASQIENAALELNRALSFVVELERGKADATHELRTLQRAAATHPSFSLLTVLDRSGRETTHLSDPAVFPEAGGKDRSQDPLVRAALQTGRAALGPLERRGSRTMLIAVHPLSDGRCVYSAYSLRGLWERLDAIRVGGGGRLLLLDAQGRPLPGVASGFPQADWRGPGAPSGETGWNESVATAAGPMVGASARAPSLGVWAMTLQPREEAFARPERFALTALLFLFGLALAATFVSVWASRRIADPLEALIAAAERVSNNDFSRPAPELGWGELNRLSKTINSMMGTLKAYQELQVERLMAEKAKVDALVHNIPDGIVLAGLDGRILYLNPWARTLLRGAAEGQRLGEALEQPALKALAAALLRRQKRSGSAEAELLQPDGSRRGVFSCRAVTVMAEQREVGVLLVLRDVTAEKDLERMKEDFFHAIVHDLRAPLSSIDGFVSLMRMNPKIGESEKRYLGFMTRSSQRLRQLVSDILDLAKLESGTLQLKREKISSAKLLDGVREVLLVQGQSAQVEMSFDCDGAAELECDPRLIERVLINIGGNALKFVSHDGQGRIAITARTSGGNVELRVSDNGPGMPQAQLDSIFDKFKQLEGGVKIGSGYGLGLSICRKIVELHGGRIWAESTLGKGSAFMVSLPAPNATKPTN